MSTEMLEYIHDRSQSHPDVNKRNARYKIRYCIKQRQPKWKGALKATQNMGKDLHKVFKNFVKYILQYLPSLGETNSKVSYFISEPRNLAKVTKFSEDIRKPWLKATQKEIKNLINDHNSLVQDPEKGNLVTPIIGLI